MQPTTKQSDNSRHQKERNNKKSKRRLWEDKSLETFHPLTPMKRERMAIRRRRGREEQNNNTRRRRG
jgi:hypothetical protein